jgi:alpha-galactosidase
MSVALNATGRPILYSMCNWGEDGPWNFASVSVHSEAVLEARKADDLAL